jgi:hypothetical protein
MMQYDTDAVAPVDGDSATTRTTGLAPAVDLSPQLGSNPRHASSRIGFLTRRPVPWVIALAAIALAATGAFLVGAGGGNDGNGSAAQVGTTVHDAAATASGVPLHRRAPIRRVSPSSR